MADIGFTGLGNMGGPMAALQGEFVGTGHGGLDCSALIRMIRGD